MRKIVHQQIDGTGNAIRVYKDGQGAPNILELYLFVFKEKKERKLGIVDKESRTLFVNRERTKHLHRNSNSYGFNYMLLKEAQSFDFIMLKDEITTYKIPRQAVLDYGDFLHFKQQGFEKQIFVPLSILETYCASGETF